MGDLPIEPTVTPADIAAIINVVSGLVTDPKAVSDADVNNDGKVDVADVIAILNILANKK